MAKNKICLKCKILKPPEEFRDNRKTCRLCNRQIQSQHDKMYPETKRAYATKNAAKIRKRKMDWAHKKGLFRPMSEAKDCAQYLGVYIAERALSKFFDHIERMPFGNPGYDFLCGKGFKIDVKSACLSRCQYGGPRWGFKIKRNTAADYFLCLAFNNRQDLEPMHVWLIPGDVINNLTGIFISDKSTSLEKWSEYERLLDKVIACCSEMKAKA